MTKKEIAIIKKAERKAYEEMKLFEKGQEISPDEIGELLYQKSSWAWTVLYHLMNDLKIK